MGARGGSGGGSGDGVLLVRMGYEDCPVMGGERVALEDSYWSLLPRGNLDLCLGRHQW